MTVEKKRINIYLPAELYTKLKQIVDCWGSSVNGYLDWLIGNEVYDFEQFSEQENSLDDANLDIKTPKELGLFYCPRCGARILGTRYRKDDDSER